MLANPHLAMSLATHAPAQLYLGFSFPGVQGWVQQNFFNVTVGRPPREVFQPPAGERFRTRHVGAFSDERQLAPTPPPPPSACSKPDLPACADVAP